MLYVDICAGGGVCTPNPGVLKGQLDISPIIVSPENPY